MFLLIIKGKLFQTENFLPILSALKQQMKEKNFLIIYPSKADYITLKNNLDIFKAIKSIATVKHFYTTDELSKIFFIKNIYLGTLLSVVHRNLILSFLLFKKTIIFFTESIPYTRLIFRYNIFFFKSIKIFLLVYPYGLKMFNNNIKRFKDANRPFSPFYNAKLADANILISSYTKNQLNKLEPKIADKFKLFNIGYDLYNWPTWNKLLERSSEKNISLLKKKKYIFFPLAVIKRYSYQCLKKTEE